MRFPLGVALSLALPTIVFASDATFSVPNLTPETAATAARAAMESCREEGFQTSVAVVDRSGILQVLFRDRFAGPHTVETAINKAWTAASFRIRTTDLANETEAGAPASPVRHFQRVVVMGGGVPIEAGGVLLGAIAVSGAPGGAADERCADAGIEAILEEIEF